MIETRAAFNRAMSLNFKPDDPPTGEVIVIDTGVPAGEETVGAMEELANEAGTTIIITPTGSDPV